MAGDPLPGELPDFPEPGAWFLRAAHEPPHRPAGWPAQRGITLLLVEVDLKAFKERDLSQEKLDEVRRAFAAVRQHGLKAIVRFAYGFTGRDYRSDPKDMDRILGHIRQLGKVFRENRDVLYGVQAGFLGPWGEWHGSNWGDPPSLQARRSVLFALLDAVPEPITVHVRRPMFIRDIFAGEPGGAELDRGDGLRRLAVIPGRLARRRAAEPSDRHGDLRPARLGPRARAAVVCRSRPLHALRRRDGPLIGAHADRPGRPRAGVAPRDLPQQQLPPGNARGLAEGGVSGRHRPTSTSSAGSDTASWRTACACTKAVNPGGTLRVELDLRNVGFAAPHMPRKVALVLSQGDRTHRVALTDADPRRWTPEAGTVTLRGAMPIPADARGGRWRLALQLADPSPSLSGDGRYAIRLANEGIAFDEASGWNVLAEDVEIKER